MKILIVDDSSEARQSLAEYLSLVVHYDVLQAGGGEEGLAMALREQPDVVLTDTQMADLSGVDMANKIKEKFPRMAIVGMSAVMYPPIAAYYARVGVTETWQKSGGMDSLVQLINLAFNNSRRP